jgi:hypothetical protein
MQIKGCQEHLNMYPTVFDLGMDEYQLFSLKAMGIRVLPKPPAPKMGTDYPGNYHPRALFKPLMLHTFCELTRDDVVYMDADAIPVASFEFPCKGLGLTPVADKKMRAYEGTPMYDYVGPYHSGVIFLGRGQRLSFLKKWAMDLFKDPLPSDKKSMNRVVKDEKITVLDSDVWNAKTLYPDTKIFHYQGPMVR